MRTLIDLPEDDVQWLDRRANNEGKSRAAVVREAIAKFRASEGRKGIERYFGIWKAREDMGDGLDHQRRIRGDWDRNWGASEA